MGSARGAGPEEDPRASCRSCSRRDAHRACRASQSERRPLVDGPAVYRNGYGKPRRLSMTCGTVTVRRPRVRGLEERFESNRRLPLFKRRTEQIGELFPQLYLHGLAQGDFESALRGLLGDGAPLSPSSIERLRGKWIAEFDAWKSRSLKGLEQPVYLWADGITGRPAWRRTRLLSLSLSPLSEDGRKVVVAIEAGHRESKEAWPHPPESPGSWNEDPSADHRRRGTWGSGCGR